MSIHKYWYMSYWNCIIWKWYCSCSLFISAFLFQKSVGTITQNRVSWQEATKEVYRILRVCVHAWTVLHFPATRTETPGDTFHPTLRMKAAILEVRLGRVSCIPHLHSRHGSSLAPLLKDWRGVKDRRMPGERWRDRMQKWKGCRKQGLGPWGTSQSWLRQVLIGAMKNCFLQTTNGVETTDKAPCKGWCQMKTIAAMA